MQLATQLCKDRLAFYMPRYYVKEADQGTLDWWHNAEMKVSDGLQQFTHYH
jgi:hypothetical protein